MDAKILRQKTPDARLHDLHDAREKLTSLVFKTSSNQLKQVREIRSLKKQIARILTIEKESEAHT